MCPRQVGGSSRGARLPAQVDRSGELPVPHPPAEPGQARDGAAVGQLDRVAGRLPVVAKGEEPIRILDHPIDLRLVDPHVLGVR